MTLSIVQNSEYEHQLYGRVRLVTHREDERVVLLERLEETTFISGVGDVPAGVRESLDAFIQHAEPADITVSPPAVEIESATPEINSQ